jgi:tetratricopeptide (TPR) repeat protein
MTKGRWQQAADVFRSMRKAAPKAPHIDCRLAACLLRMDDQKGAFDIAGQELKHDPNCVAALGLVTSIMVLQPDSDQKLRLEYMRRLSTLAPNEIDFLHMYAEELTNEYRYEEMRPIAAKILTINPNDAEAYNLLGYADLASPKQPEGVKLAQGDFQQSLAINPANGGAHFGLGRAALRLGDAREAVANLEMARSMRPDAARINYELSTAYRLAGQPAKADAAKSRFLAWQQVNAEHRQLQVRSIAYPKDPRFPKRLGLLLIESNGDPAEALYYLKKANEMAPGDKAVVAAMHELAASGRLPGPRQLASAGAIPGR